MSVGSSPVTGWKCQSWGIVVDMSFTSFLKWSGVSVSYFWLSALLFLSAMAFCEGGFPLVRFTLYELVFVFYRPMYKLTTKGSKVVSLLKKAFRPHATLEDTLFWLYWST